MTGPSASPYRKALAIFRDLGHRGGEATALTNLGDVSIRLGRHQEAVAEHAQAIAIFGDLGERYGEMCALNGQGEALAGLGRSEAAIASHSAALTLAREIDEPEGRAAAEAALLGEIFDVELPADEVETVGGLLAQALGRVPIPGAEAELAGLRLIAEGTTGRRNHIDSVLVRRAPAAADEDERSPGPADPTRSGEGRSRSEERQPADV